MNARSTYLTSLRGKIFKILPMKEQMNEGKDNHLEQYMENILQNMEGALVLYPELATEPKILDVQATISYLYNNPNDAMTKWRSSVLRCVRLVQNVVNSYENKEKETEGK